MNFSIILEKKIIQHIVYALVHDYSSTWQNFRKEAVSVHNPKFSRLIGILVVASAD